MDRQWSVEARTKENSFGDQAWTEIWELALHQMEFVKVRTMDRKRIP
jgi:hypothetical protein